MVLGFMAEFVPQVIEGTKPHSFRENRKDGSKWKVGDTIQFYTGAYQLQTAVYRKVQLGRIEEECFNEDENPTERVFIKEKRFETERTEMKMMLQKWADEL